MYNPRVSRFPLPPTLPIRSKNLASRPAQTVIILAPLSPVRTRCSLSCIIFRLCNTFHPSSKYSSFDRYLKIVVIDILHFDVKIDFENDSEKICYHMKISSYIF